MPKTAVRFVRAVEGMNRRLGRAAMYLLFVMMGVLLWSAASKTFFQPSLWTLEMAQFLMVAYFLLGGPYSLQLGSNVRMDLFYGSWSPRTKAAVDAVTILALVFYLGVLLYGGLGSLAYSLGYFGTEPLSFYADLAVATARGEPGEALGFMERSRTIWRPYMWPIKTVMCVAVFLMLLQAVAVFLKDVAFLRGEEL